MAANKLDKAGQVKLLGWLAAGFGGGTIRRKLSDAKYEEISDATITYYRKKWHKKISDELLARHDAALTSGLALKAERVARLIEHAEEIEDKRQQEDNLGKPSWAPEWRATLADIASEMGDRKGNESGGEEALVKVYVGIDYEGI